MRPEFFSDGDFAALTLNNITQDEVNALMATEEPAKTRLLLLMYDAVEGMYAAVQKTYPHSIDNAPSKLREPLKHMLNVQLTFQQVWGWLDEDGNRTDKMPL